MNNQAIGKLPPQDIEAEKAVLGAVLQFKNAVNDIIGMINPDDFYKKSHKEIFEAVIDLYRENEPIDLLTATNRLRKNGKLESVGGAYYLTELTSYISSEENTGFHCLIVKEAAMKRDLIELSHFASVRSFDSETDVFELLEEVGSKLIDIDAGINAVKSKKYRAIIPEVIERIKNAAKEKNGVTGITTGYFELDKITGGWQNTELVIIAARPGMGKSDVAINVSIKAAEKGSKVALFSLEMGEVQVGTRILTATTKIKRDAVKSGRLNDSEWEKVSKIEKTILDNIYIQDNPSLNTMQFRSICKKLKLSDGVDMVVVDYLQLMSGVKKGQNREQEISEIARTLKLVAMELKIPVIALSQLSRAVETRGGDKKPILSDLRESGAIEQDANIVMFPYRPIYYGIEQYGEIYDTKKLMVMDIAKNRDGKTGETYLTYDPSIGAIWDYMVGSVENSIPEPETAYHPDKFHSNGLNDFETKGKAPF